MTKINADQETRDSIDILCDLLGGAGVESFFVYFSGGNDDGQIEDPSDFEPKSSGEAVGRLLGEPVKGGMCRFGDPDAGGPTLRVLIGDVCYSLIESAFPGWELDDGSSGHFHFDVNERKVNLELNERVMEFVSHEFSL